MRKSMSIFGLQNGDEGKGKFVDLYASLCKEVLTPGERILQKRYQGGSNAGHTVNTGNESFALHQIGSSITIPSVYVLLGTGMYFNPRSGMKEIEYLMSRGVSVTPNNLGISSRTHVTLDHHVREDQGSYDLKEHTSTGKGIKQTARDKYFRTGMRFIEFLDPELMEKILKEKMFPDGMPLQIGISSSYVESYHKERTFLAPFLVEETSLTNDSAFAFHIYEGAQGFMLDIDDGQYPGITSSNPCRPPVRTDQAMGVFKAYVSSVGIGERPFVSEMQGPLQDILWEGWKEYGTTTGKRRHIGWLDMVALKYAIETTNPDLIAMSCLDRLEDLHKVRKQGEIVVGYSVDKEIHYSWHHSFDRRDTLKQAIPITENFQTWSETTTKSGRSLTPPAEDYIRLIEYLSGRSIDLVGVGPARNQTIDRKGNGTTP